MYKQLYRKEISPTRNLLTNTFRIPFDKNKKFSKNFLIFDVLLYPVLRLLSIFCSRKSLLVLQNLKLAI